MEIGVSRLWLKTAIVLLCFYSAIGCNQAKAVNVDASSSVIGAFLSDGSLGLYGGGPSIHVTVSGYLNVTGKPMGLTLTDSTGAIPDQNLSITADGTFPFATPLNPNSAYTVSLGSYTKGQSCSIVTGNTGTAGVSGPTKIDCERTLAILGIQLCCPSAIQIFAINHKTSPFTAEASTIPLASSAIDPTAADLIWNGKNYLALWMGDDKTIVGQFYDIELTPLAPSFSVYSGGTATQRGVAVAYNSILDEYGIVISETSPAVKYLRLSALGAPIGPVTTVETLGPATAFGNLDIVWDGIKYITAFEEHNTVTQANSLAIYSFTTGVPAFVHRISLATGTGLITPSNGAPNGAIGAAFPNFLRTATDTWLFYNQTNVNTSGITIDSSLMEWKNFSGSPVQIARDFQPFACNPTSDPTNGFQFYMPHAASFGNQILLSYDLHCEEAITSPFLFDNVFHAPIDPVSGAKGTSTLYTASTGHNRTFGSSITCRKDRCFTSAGTFIDSYYLLDPGFDGSVDQTFRIATSSGQAFFTFIQ